MIYFHITKGALLFKLESEGLLGFLNGYLVFINDKLSQQTLKKSKCHVAVSTNLLMCFHFILSETAVKSELEGIY